MSTTLPTIAQPGEVSEIPHPTFHLFPRLPLEIRLEIWNLVPPRAVGFQPGGGPAPAALSACKESRNELRPKYSLEKLRQSDAILNRAVFMNYEVDTFNISSMQGERASQLFVTAQQLYPSYLARVKKVMVGVPRFMEGADGFKHWWWFTPWRLIGTGCGTCSFVVFIFGGDERTRLEDVRDIGEVCPVNWDEGNFMACIRESLDLARDEGYCGKLEIGFARDERKCGTFGSS
jgi:hypothetical protein